MSLNLDHESKWTSDLKSRDQLLLSIVVTSYSRRRAGDLRDLFESVTKQGSLDMMELIVIIEKENALFDYVKRVLNEIHSLSSTVLYFPHIGGMSGARNIGAEESRGKFIAFVDDDVILDEGWFASLSRVVNSHDIISITGPSHPLWGSTKLDWLPRELSWLVGSTDWFDCHALTEVRNAWGYNMAVRRSEFLAVHGFTERFGLHNASRKRWFDPPSEDVDLSLRLVNRFGKPVLYVPGFSVHHKVLSQKVSVFFMAQRAYSLGFQRKSIRMAYSKLKAEGSPLSLEMSLVPRMLLLLPKSMAKAPKSPTRSLHIISSVVIVLLFAFLGHLDKRAY